MKKIKIIILILLLIYQQGIIVKAEEKSSKITNKLQTITSITNREENSWIWDNVVDVLRKSGEKRKIKGITPLMEYSVYTVKVDLVTENESVIILSYIIHFDGKEWYIYGNKRTKTIEQGNPVD